MVTHDLPVGRSDYNDSFARYLANVSPNLIHDTNDISCISKMTTSGPNTKPILHGNIAEELNNFDSGPLPAVMTKRDSSGAPRISKNQGLNDPMLNS